MSLGAVAAPSLARPSLPAQFARLDGDHDGRLSLGEFEQNASVRVALGSGAAHDLAPSDREGLLRLEFGRIDANRDGEIALDEFRRYYGR
ncbi:MAG: EF-hand domain-containing protein [Caulobacteraceae bacterium]